MGLFLFFAELEVKSKPILLCHTLSPEEPFKLMKLNRGDFASEEHWVMPQDSFGPMSSQ